MISLRRNQCYWICILTSMFNFISSPISILYIILVERKQELLIHAASGNVIQLRMLAVEWYCQDKISDAKAKIAGVYQTTGSRVYCGLFSHATSQLNTIFLFVHFS